MSRSRRGFPAFDLLLAVAAIDEAGYRPAGPDHDRQPGWVRMRLRAGSMQRFLAAFAPAP